MRYMMLMYSRETPEGPSPDEVDYLIRTHGALMTEARQQGVLLSVEGDAAVFKKGLDMTPNTRNVFFSNPQDKATIDGINNLIAINARTFGKSNNYYQKYMQAYGLENTMAGEFVKGAKQMTAPMFYNLLNKAVFESPTIKRFVQASGRLSADSPQGLAAANQFSKMVNQAIAAQVANSQPAIQTTNQLLGQQ